MSHGGICIIVILFQYILLILHVNLSALLLHDMANMVYLYKYVLCFQFKAVHHMNYEHWSHTVETFLITAFRNHHEDETRCNNHLQIETLTNVMENA